uniref:Uncharacterized protein n=1 Tax=Eutreptiella gymnastica TaxID=73025 RepID=A0A7S4LK43_9EUGL
MFPQLEFLRWTPDGAPPIRSEIAPFVGPHEPMNRRRREECQSDTGSRPHVSSTASGCVLHREGGGRQGERECRRQRADLTPQIRVFPPALLCAFAGPHHSLTRVLECGESVGRPLGLELGPSAPRFFTLPD